MAGDPFAIAWDMGYSTYAPGASRVDEYSWKENYYTTNIYSDYLKSFSSGHYFKVMVGFNAELYKTRNISAQKNTLITPSVPTLNTATGEANASGAYNHTAVAGFSHGLTGVIKTAICSRLTDVMMAPHALSVIKDGDSFLLFRRVGILPEKSFCRHGG